MIELVVISGKGGTGKTSVTAAFASLVDKKIIVDADVDAPDLHIILKPKIQRENPFYGMKRSYINKERCIECGNCIKVCRFEAISSDFIVDPIACDGCAICHHVCPVKAIDMVNTLSGHWYISQSRLGPFIHGKLEIGEENSGKLIALLRKQAQFLASKEQFPLIIIDGPPGAGCPVNSSLAGANYGIAIAEPTKSGIHDLARIIDLMEHFKVTPFLIVNKSDINSEIAEEIENYGKMREVNILGEIPFDPSVTKAQMEGLTVVEKNGGPASLAIKNIWKKLQIFLNL